MEESRRSFLKIATCAGVGALWGIPVVRAVARAFEPSRAAATESRLGMVIDTRRCGEAGVMAAAVQACHQRHNVPLMKRPEEAVHWIWSTSYEKAFPTDIDRFTPAELKNREMLVLCNHCDSAPCVRVCPTQATWKRAQDGIVMMDMHRCIGCRYCVAACPYGARSFNWRDPRPFIKEIQPDFPTRSKGVVEKCTLCADLLERHQGPISSFEPACVRAANQVAPGAMVFGDLADPGSAVNTLIRQHATVRRKLSLGTSPQVFYIV